MKILFLILLSSASAMAFTPPTDITPYLPANNVVGVTQITSNVPKVDQYAVDGTVVTSDKFGNCTSMLSDPLEINTCVYNVTHGTSELLVMKLASANNAWAQFKVATLTPSEQVNPLQLQTAMIWFMNHIYVKY